MATPIVNFGKVTVSTGYDAVATSIALTTGHGSRLPSTFPYPLPWWNATDNPDPADDPNKEIVLVTNRVGDTLTVIRAQEGTSATVKNVAGKTYKMLLGITKAMWEELGDRALSQTFRGLALQTHPDSDVAARKVLLTADAIVMDDSTKVSGWTNVVADLSLSGIGGLDTGTEQNSTWYELWAMYNGTTQALQFHRAKDYFLDEDTSAIVTEDATQGCRSAVDNSTVKVSQGFQVDTSGKVEFIDVKLIKVGAPTGNGWFTIEANSAGVPSNTPLATSDKLDVARLSTTATWIRLPFRTPVSLSAATQYHLVLQGDWAVSATNYVGWRMDGSAAGYTKGSKALFDSDTNTWTVDTDDDLLCKVYITRNDTALTLNGYTLRAKVGYAYNDSAGNLVPFRQQDRQWRHATLTNGLVVNETVTGVQLIDLRSWLPPLHLLPVSFALTGTGAGPASAAVSDVTGTDISNSVTAGAQGYLYSASSLEVPAGESEILISASAVMIEATAGADLYVQGFKW
jgi:hypothetical protein